MFYFIPFHLHWIDQCRHHRWARDHIRSSEENAADRLSNARFDLIAALMPIACANTFAQCPWLKPQAFHRMPWIGSNCGCSHLAAIVPKHLISINMTDNKSQAPIYKLCSICRFINIACACAKRAQQIEYILLIFPPQTANDYWIEYNYFSRMQECGALQRRPLSYL